MASDPERVVFDCVICAQAIINPFGPAGRCVELAKDGVVSLCISDYLIAEIRQLPSKLAPRLRITDEKVGTWVADLVSFAIHFADVPERYRLERDPKDSPYINLALVAEAKIVTSRDKDLLDLMDASRPESREFQQLFPALRILTPGQFLSYILPPSADEASET